MSGASSAAACPPAWPASTDERIRRASTAWSRLGGHHPTSPGGSMRSLVPARLLLAAMVCLVAAACGGSGDNSGGAAPASPTTTTAASGTTAAASQACADAAALKASVDELDQIDPKTAGK